MMQGPLLKVYHIVHQHNAYRYSNTTVMIKIIVPTAADASVMAVQTGSESVLVSLRALSLLPRNVADSTVELPVI
eukprot:m.122737 g.122737  ORF g.122737 m.122737 type:complete len:75 (+) comp13741_c0_seq1:4212-4436(+)